MSGIHPPPGGDASSLAGRAGEVGDASTAGNEEEAPLFLKIGRCLMAYRRAFFPALLGSVALCLSGLAVFAIGKAVLDTPVDRFTLTQLIGLIVTFVGAALVCYAVTGGDDAAQSKRIERPAAPRKFDDRQMRLAGGQLVLGMGLLVVMLALLLAR